MDGKSSGFLYKNNDSSMRNNDSSMRNDDSSLENDDFVTESKRSKSGRRGQHVAS